MPRDRGSSSLPPLLVFFAQGRLHSDPFFWEREMRASSCRPCKVCRSIVGGARFSRSPFHFSLAHPRVLLFLSRNTRSLFSSYDPPPLACDPCWAAGISIFGQCAPVTGRRPRSTRSFFGADAFSMDSRGVCPDRPDAVFSPPVSHAHHSFFFLPEPF